MKFFPSFIKQYHGKGISTCVSVIKDIVKRFSQAVAYRSHVFMMEVLVSKIITDTTPIQFLFIFNNSLEIKNLVICTFRIIPLSL